MEAFIAGWDLDEAIKRADAYRNAGADAILIHSKLSEDTQIRAFVKEWKQRHPLVIVPTKYYKTPTSTFREWGVNMVIWANHNMRACVKVMQSITKTIKEKESLVDVEDKIAKVNEIFRLTDMDGLKNDDSKYL